MFATLLCLLATVTAAQPKDAIVIKGITIDAAGKPLAGVEVTLAALKVADETAATVARTSSDEHGAFHLELARQRRAEIGLSPFLWAYHPGLAVAIVVPDLTGNTVTPILLRLAEPLKRGITVVDSDNRPVAGARLQPVLLSIGPRTFQAPGDRLERLTVETGADGIATVSYFPDTTDLLTVRVTAAGIAPHNLPLPSQSARDRATLKLGRPVRLTGSVFNDLGQPISDVAVEVWVENSYYPPRLRTENGKATRPPSLIRFDSGPVRTQADGKFETPAQLMTGERYRVMIRGNDNLMVGSDWVTASAEPTAFPPLRLREHRGFAGVVHDRQGQPVAGARVCLPSGKPSTTSDDHGRFLLDGTLPQKTYLLIKANGFRFHGRPVITSRQPVEQELTVVRTTEAPDHIMTAHPEPISTAESRALARRLLEPALQSALANGDEAVKSRQIYLLAQIEPARALELLENHPLANHETDASIRHRIASQMLGTDPKEAESIVDALTTPEWRAYGYAYLAEVLPPAERERRRTYLERATIHARAGAGRGNIRSRLDELSYVANGWLDFGDIEQARPLIKEGLMLTEALPVDQQFHRYFLPAAARLEPERMLSIVRGFSERGRRLGYSVLAESLAKEHPAEAERVFGLIDDVDKRIVGEQRVQIAVRVCWNLARTDPERARRIITRLKRPQELACAWAVLALGLVERDKPAARAALAEALGQIGSIVGADLLEKSEGLPVATVFLGNPAAAILPIVERVAPEQLEEVFWQAVALMPTDETALARGVVSNRIAAPAIFLARYDRQVADYFVTRGMSSTAGERAVYSLPFIRARAAIDPVGAVALMEASPPDHPNPQPRANSAACDALVRYLIEPAEDHWKSVWQGFGMPLDEMRNP